MWAPTDMGKKKHLPPGKVTIGFVMLYANKLLTYSDSKGQWRSQWTGPWPPVPLTLP